MFFFKQKTAYEMRISDWSSDVCSSDLAARNQLLGVASQSEKLQGVRPEGMEDAPELRVQIDRVKARALGLSIADVNGTDRKSVVSGKSVSVRVDLGGRRIIKKKTL